MHHGTGLPALTHGSPLCASAGQKNRNALHQNLLNEALSAHLHLFVSNFFVGNDDKKQLEARLMKPESMKLESQKVQVSQQL